MAWYRIVLECSGVPPDTGEAGAAEITEEFARRAWHRNVNCARDGKRLTLTAENDYDRDGRALVDEFSDAITACISGGFDGDPRVVSTMEVA